MSGKKKKKVERPVYDSIRKPTAPPTKSFAKSNADERLYPAQRKIKHKKNDDSSK